MHLLVRINSDPWGAQPRRLVSASVAKQSVRTLIVKLPDGSAVKRKIARDVPAGERLGLNLSA
jgi:hypothetical protein